MCGYLKTRVCLGRRKHSTQYSNTMNWEFFVIVTSEMAEEIKINVIFVIKKGCNLLTKRILNKCQFTF